MVKLTKFLKCDDALNAAIVQRCVYARAHLDVILSVQSLDKTGEAMKEPICCSSLEGGRGRERKSCLAHIVCNLTLFNNQSVSTSPSRADTAALKCSTLGA